MRGLFGGHLPGRGAEDLGSGEDVEPEVAAAFGPFVVPLGQDGADEAGDRVPVGADADHVGAAADLLVEPVVGVVRPDLPPDILGERGEGEDALAGVLEMLRHAGQLLCEGVGDAVELGLDRCGVGLVVDGMQRCRHQRQELFGVVLIRFAAQWVRHRCQAAPAGSRRPPRSGRRARQR